MDLTKINKFEKFEIEIDFNKNTPNPSRIFKSMASIIEAFEELDKNLVNHIDSKIDTILVLEDIEKGSLKSVLRNIISGIPDDALKDLDIKKLIGHYLLKTKYIILKKLEDRVLLTDGNVIEEIEFEIIEEAKNTGISKLPYYVPVTKKTLIENIKGITDSVENLQEGDSVIYKSEEGTASFNMSFSLDIELMEALITKESIVSHSKMILKVKKPDYLGDSMWVFKHGVHTINAKIEDLNWLQNYQSGDIDIRPQDSLVCDVEIVAKYDHDNNLIEVTYTIQKVRSISSKRANENKETLFGD
ncbi:MAG: hypothetical protein JPMHGGIA_02261 [Saprospiraceae bacterium]|nr:hypothetical protein [Saprospiraceae bacterium]